jgi:hypothetical protein
MIYGASHKTGSFLNGFGRLARHAFDSKSVAKLLGGVDCVKHPLIKTTTDCETRYAQTILV